MFIQGRSYLFFVCKPVPYLLSVVRGVYVWDGGGGEESSRPINCSIHALLRLRVAYKFIR